MAETSSEPITPRSFKKGDKIRVRADWEGIVRYDFTADSDGFTVTYGDGSRGVWLPREVTNVELIASAEPEYEEGMPYEDADGDIFIRRYEDEPNAESQPWMDTCGNLEAEDVPVRPLTLMTAN